MLKTLFDYAPRALALLPPEEAHEVTLKSLELGVFPSPLPHPMTRRCASTSPACRCPIPLVLLPVSTRTRGCPTPSCSSAAALPRSAR